MKKHEGFLRIVLLLVPIMFFTLLAVFCTPPLHTESTPAPNKTTAPDASETIGMIQTVTLQPSFSSEDGVNVSRVELSYTLEPGQTIRLLVKGDPPIPGGGFIGIGMDMEPGIELVFREPVTTTSPVYTGSGTIKSFWIPGDQEQKVLMFVRNVGDKTSVACFRLTYEHPPEPEPEPENKGMNDPPLPEVSTPAPTPKAL